MVSQPKYVLKAASRIKKFLTKDDFAEGRRNTARRMKRLLDHPEYGRKFAQLDVKDQERILSRVHRPFSVSAKAKQRLLFKDIDDTLNRKKRRLAGYKKSRALGIRGGTGTPEERARRYASLNPTTRSEAWPGDETTEFWNQYKHEMGYVA
jgi:hypothetical protein